MLKTFALEEVTGSSCSKDEDIDEFDVNDGDVKVAIERIKMKDVGKQDGGWLKGSNGSESSQFIKEEDTVFMFWEIPILSENGVFNVACDE